LAAVPLLLGVGCALETGVAFALETGVAFALETGVSPTAALASDCVGLDSIKDPKKEAHKQYI
jgi:hypothetical protein